MLIMSRRVVWILRHYVSDEYNHPPLLLALSFANMLKDFFGSMHDGRLCYLLHLANRCIALTNHFLSDMRSFTGVGARSLNSVDHDK